jgi:hypothetical protein
VTCCTRAGGVIPLHPNEQAIPATVAEKETVHPADIVTDPAGCGVHFVVALRRLPDGHVFKGPITLPVDCPALFHRATVNAELMAAPVDRCDVLLALVRCPKNCLPVSPTARMRQATLGFSGNADETVLVLI